jgi:hypothetical protein
MLELGPLFDFASAARAASKARRGAACWGACVALWADWPLRCYALQGHADPRGPTWRLAGPTCASVPATFGAQVVNRVSRARAHAYPLARMRRRARSYVVVSRGMLVSGVPNLDKRRTSKKR